MSGVVAKFFISFATESPDGSVSYQMGVVCRGEENKHWAAATPAGSMKHGDDELLAMLWREHQRDNSIAAEVEVLLIPAEEGEWVFDKCDFSYGGCAVHFRQKGKPWGTLDMTINATGATKVLRDAYAAALGEGNPAHFDVSFRNATG